MPSAPSEAHVLEPAIGELRQCYWTHPCLGLQMARIQAHKHTGTQHTSHSWYTWAVNDTSRLGVHRQATYAFGGQAKWHTMAKCGASHTDRYNVAGVCE